MFRNRLAEHETYVKGNNGQYDVDRSYAVYEVFIEPMRDKNGEIIKGKDGNDRYYPIDDLSLNKLNAPALTKKIREDLFKVIYEVNGDKVEKVERDGKRVYYVVNEEKISTIPAGTQVVIKGDYIHIPSEIGYVIVDERDIEHPKVVGVRKFKTEDHKAEAEKIVKNFHSRPQKN